MTDRPLEDWEYPDPDDGEDEDAAEVTECPHCGEEIYEDAEQCPYCGAYVSAFGGSPLAGRPWWYILLALLGIIAVIAAFSRF